MPSSRPTFFRYTTANGLWVPMLSAGIRIQDLGVFEHFRICFSDQRRMLSFQPMD